MIKKASAIWKGSIKDGSGTISTETGVLNNAPYGFKSRFENGKGTNPEELLGAAHAGCFSMALSLILGEAGMTAEKIETQAAVTLEKVGDGFSITSSHLEVTAKIPGADPAKFQEAANKAKAGCPLSKVLNAKITMNAKLEG
jgi:lipoyl-dependent peroxiredoxin